MTTDARKSDDLAQKIAEKLRECASWDDFWGRVEWDEKQAAALIREELLSSELVKAAEELKDLVEDHLTDKEQPHLICGLCERGSVRLRAALESLKGGR